MKKKRDSQSKGKEEAERQSVEKKKKRDSQSTRRETGVNEKEEGPSVEARQ